MTSITALKKIPNPSKITVAASTHRFKEESLLVRLIFVSGRPIVFALDTSGVTEL